MHRIVDGRALAALVCGVPLCIVAACTRAIPPHEHEEKLRLVQKTHVAILRADQPRRSNVFFSDDGRRFAFVSTNADKQPYMVSTNGRGSPHTEISPPQFAPHTHRLFYWQIDDTAAGKTFTVNVDGAEFPTPYAKPGQLAFSDAGGRWAAIGFDAGPTPDRPGTFYILGEGKELGRHVDVSVPAVSREGHVAYLARDAGPVGLIAGGPIGLMVDGALRSTYSPPVARCGAAPEDDTKPQLPEHHVVRYFADGSLLVLTRDADGWGIYHDDTRLASYPASTIDRDDDACRTSARLAHKSIRVADDAPVAAWFERLAGDAERWRVVRNGEPVDDVICTAPWRRQPPELSADGQHVSYACASKGAEDHDQVLIVKDAERYGPYGEVWGIALSKNGAHVGYGATVGAAARPWAVVVDGEVRTRGYTSVWRPIVLDDGTAAWEAKLADVPLGFIGIDARPVGAFDSVLWGPEPEPDDRIAWIVRRVHKLTRVSVPRTAGRKLASPTATR